VVDLIPFLKKGIGLKTKYKGESGMTKVMCQDINCLKCGSKQTISIYETINATISPDLKEKLIKGEINIFRCQKCGEEGFIPVPLLYHDMHKEFCVQFYPFDCLNDNGFLENFTKEGDINLDIPVLTEFPMLTKYADYLKRTHIVFDINELARYVIFRDKLSGKWEKAT
jgi:hypothetical protein